MVVAKNVVANPSNATRQAVIKISRDNPMRIIVIGTIIEDNTPKVPTTPACCGFPAAFAKDANIAPAPALAVKNPNR